MTADLIDDHCPVAMWEAGRSARALSFALIVAVSACESAPVHEQASILPQPSDWVDCGPVLHAGGEGEWDRHIWGGFAASILKRDGRYLLYYQGSAGYHEVEHTVMNRAIGVAVSTDGLRFAKHPSNPVLTFSPKGNHEEGAVSSAPLVDEENRVVMYYGANTWAGGDRVNADARLAVSEDGIHFSDMGVVLDHTDASVWGSGDELFPILAFRDGERRLLYYLPNGGLGGTLRRGRLGVARSEGTNGWQTAAVVSGRRSVRAWGAGSAVRIGSGTYALFLANNGGSNPQMEVRTMSAARPDHLSAPVHRYQWTDISPQTVLFDVEEDRWLMYYRRGTHEQYGVMVAVPRLRHGDPELRAQLCEPELP